MRHISWQSSVNILPRNWNHFAAFCLPQHLLHPSETEIRTYVSSLIQTAKRNKRKRDINPDDTQGTTQGSSASRARLDLSSEELDFITNTCKETPNMRPSEFYTLFIAKYPSTALSVAQIKTKFSNVKASLKN